MIFCTSTDSCFSVTFLLPVENRINFKLDTLSYHILHIGGASVVEGGQLPLPQPSILLPQLSTTPVVRTTMLYAVLLLSTLARQTELVFHFCQHWEIEHSYATYAHSPHSDNAAALAEFSLSERSF